MPRSNFRGRMFFASSLGSVLLAASLSSLSGMAGCAVSAKGSAEATERAWMNDKYVPPTDERTRAMNAARVLAMPERAANRTMQVGAVSAIVHERPTVTSRALGSVSAGDAVKVLVEADFVRIPTTSDMNEYVGTKGGDITPSWVKVKSGAVEGWMPARALVNPIEYATSSDSLVGAEVDGAKGFSQKVKREATAMKGAAGTPKLKGANYAAADAILDRMKSPMKFTVSADAFAPMGRAAGVAPASQTLDAVDPGVAASAAAAIAKANQPSDFAKTADGVLGGLSKVGIGAADDPAVRAGVEAAKFAEFWMTPYPVTPAEERILGRECLAQMLGSGQVLPDDHPVTCYVRWVGAKVAAQSTAAYPSLGLEFIVLKDDDVNAVAVPGGPIVMTTGMLSFLENEHELAAILAHEVTHVEERHGLNLAVDKGLPKLPKLIEFCEKQSRGAFEPLIAKQLAAAKLPDAVAKQVPGLVSKELSKQCSKILEECVYAVVNDAWKEGEQGVETGADLRGMSLASAAGYDPAALDAVLERLKAKTGEYGGANYSPERADLDRRLLPLLPSPGGATAAGAPAEAAAAAPVRKVAPSKQEAARWSQIDAELRK